MCGTCAPLNLCCLLVLYIPSLSILIPTRRDSCFFKVVGTRNHTKNIIYYFNITLLATRRAVYPIHYLESTMIMLGWSFPTMHSIKQYIYTRIIYLYIISIIYLDRYWYWWEAVTVTYIVIELLYIHPCRSIFSLAQLFNWRNCWVPTGFCWPERTIARVTWPGSWTHSSMSHRIGWWENLQESPICDGKNHGFL